MVGAWHLPVLSEACTLTAVEDEHNAVEVVPEGCDSDAKMLRLP